MFGGEQEGTIHQLHHIDGVATKAEVLCIVLGSEDAAPHTYICPSLCRCRFFSQHLPNGVRRLPAEQGLQEAKAGSSQVLPPYLHRKDREGPHSPARFPAHFLQAAESLLQLSPRQNQWLVTAEAISCRFGEVWHGGTLGKLHRDSLLQFMHATAVFWCIFPLLVWHLEGVKCYVMISMIAIILPFTQDILLKPLLLFSERWGSRVHCDSRSRFSLW